MSSNRAGASSFLSTAAILGSQDKGMGLSPGEGREGSLPLPSQPALALPRFHYTAAAASRLTLGEKNKKDPLGPEGQSLTRDSFGMGQL